MGRKVLSFLILIFFLSCNEKKEDQIDSVPQVPFEQLEYTITLPDTVSVNKPYKASIQFKSDFDSIMLPIQVDVSDTTKMRLITFYHFEPIKIPLKSRGEMVLIDSTFVLNKNFEIDNIVFKEKGEFMFSGLIRDEIMYNFYNSRGICDSVHFDKRMQQIFKKVVVID